MAIFDIEENIDNIDSNILKDKMSQYITLINGGRKSGTQLIIDPFNQYDVCGPFVKNELEHTSSYIRQIFIPNNIEVLDYIINLFETTTPSEMNFIDRYWNPDPLDGIDTILYYIKDPFIDEFIDEFIDDPFCRYVDLGCGLEYDPYYEEIFHINLIPKLKNSEYISFDNGICEGQFTMYFNQPQYKLPVLKILWNTDSYIDSDSDNNTITGEVEVATFYQILKIYKQFIDSI